MKEIENILNILKCQQCLSSLKLINRKLICYCCNNKYPISNELIFMGYNQKDHEETQKIIQLERDHQTDLADMQHHYDFAPNSFKIGLLAIDNAKTMIDIIDPIAIDIGSGGAPFAKILTEQGFNTFRLELDPNSLYSGLFWRHPNLGIGKHIVSDASILPFDNNSIDLVFCKEFIHHIEDYKNIFNEISRVLKIGGIFLMLEPTKKFKFLRTKNEIDSIETYYHHYRTNLEYYFALKRCGFTIQRYYLFYSAKSKRIKLLNYLKKHFNNQIYKQQKLLFFSNILKLFIQRIISGENIIFAKKINSVKMKEKRPDIKIVDPRILVLNSEYLNDPKVLKFIEILNGEYDNFETKNYDI